MAQVPAMQSLLAFEAVARRRSFALAAMELHLTAAAVSHPMARLEAQLGLRLFERSAHGMRLSAAGEAYLARVSGALAALVAASDDLRQGVSHRLYVHSTPSLAMLWLLPRLSGFAKACPEIALNLPATHTHSDFAPGPTDIDIRCGVPQWPNLVEGPLFEESIVPLIQSHVERGAVGRLVCEIPGPARARALCGVPLAPCASPGGGGVPGVAARRGRPGLSRLIRSAAASTTERRPACRRRRGR